MPFYLKNFIVYKSSAGSGKTFTLVKEYLKLALKDKTNLQFAYKAILAMTFTNKAASEMKWRIIKALKEISTGSNQTLAALVAGEIGITIDELSVRADVVLVNILHNYSDFSIGTIDSFTHRVIRTFAIDLKLPVNFQIETDSDTVFRKVISELINNLGKDQLITEYLVQYSLAQVQDNKNWDPEKTLIEFIKEINKEGIADLIQLLSRHDISDFEIIKKQLAAFIKAYESVLKTNGEAALKLIHDRALSAEVFAGGANGIYNLFVKLALLKETSEAELFKSTVTKTLTEDKWHAAKAGVSDKQSIDSIKAELARIATDVLSYIQQNQQRYTVFTLIYKNIYAIGLVNELAKLTAQYKLDENILFISEFNQRIADVVNHEPAPFIFERLGDRYRHFLLDEFQDTSAMQWQNLLPLIDNSLGNGHLNLIVGDGKQSIYRWRNADVKQFMDLPNVNASVTNPLLQEREQSLVRNFEENVLDKNYRSDSVIVKFNNELFSYLSETVLYEEFKKIYHKHVQEFKPGDAGFVSINFPELTEEDADLTNLNYVLKYIRQATDDGYSHSDICIIIRQNRHGNLVANFLIEQGIPVVSAESLLLKNAKEVNVLISFLNYISNQKDLVSASVVLNYLHDTRVINEEQYVVFLRALNVSGTKTLFTILTECGLAIDIPALTVSGLFNCCLETVSSLKLNESNPQYIRFFLDEVLSFLQGNTSNIPLFLDWWEKRSEKASVIIPEGIDAVNIMTIHASKGLEFNVVISPYLSWDVEKIQSIWIGLDEEEIDLPVALINTTKATDDTIYKPLAEQERQQQTLDSLNMLYVDFTRAVERLHIISPQLKKASKKNVFTWLHEFAHTYPGFDEESQQLTFGSPIQKVKTTGHKQGLEQLPAHRLSFNHKEGIVTIKSSSAYNSNEEVVKAREYGILVHLILSQIKTTEDLARVIQNTVQSGDISQEEAEKIKVDITALLSNPLISGYFEKGVEMKNELEIITENGEILRPDRVVVLDTKEAIVIDYKTGKRNASKYHQQMKQYEQALYRLGYSPVKKMLLYIYENEVEIVS